MTELERITRLEEQLSLVSEALRLALVTLNDISHWDSVDVNDIRKVANYTIEHVNNHLRI